MRRKSLIGLVTFLGTFLMLLPMLFLSWNKAYANDVSNNITSLTVSPSQINDGGKTTVKFNFDEHAQKIKSGDTLTVTWQNSGTIYASGYTKTVKLEVDNQYVGDLVITTDKAVVTFNSGIDSLQNITGWGEFEIEGRNLTQTSDENSGTFTITGGNQSTNVTVVKPSSGVTSVFYYKTGDMQTNDTGHVRWFLNINNNKKYVDSEIRIEDDIQSGQTLDINSFDIVVAGYRNQNYSGSDAITQFMNDFPGSSISADPTTGKITVIIPQSYASLSSFSIMYLTNVDKPNQKTFDNHSKAWYKENGKEAVSGKEFNYSVTNVNANGGIDGNTTTEAPTTTT
ncbi:collagen binding domain-containing protein, partial [Streptococcus mutans]